MKSAGFWILISAPICNHNRGYYSTRLSVSHCTLAWYRVSSESAARKVIFSSLESPALAGACISVTNTVRSATWSGASIPCDPWSGSGSPICSLAVLLLWSSFGWADWPLPLVSHPMPAQTSSPESLSSEDDDDLSSPARFGLFTLAFQVSPIPMSCVLSCGSQPENIRPTCPTFWWEVKNSQRVRRSSWRRWDGSSSWNPLGRSSTLKKVLGDLAISFQHTRALGFLQ